MPGRLRNIHGAVRIRGGEETIVWFEEQRQPPKRYREGAERFRGGVAAHCGASTAVARRWIDPYKGF